MVKTKDAEVSDSMKLKNGVQSDTNTSRVVMDGAVGMDKQPKAGKQAGMK